MKLRQKLAAVLAATMVVTAVPVVTFAASTNRITHVAKVTEGTKLEGNVAPDLVIDLKDGITTTSPFYVTIEGASFKDGSTALITDADIKFVEDTNGSPVDFEIVSLSDTEVGIQVKAGSTMDDSAAIDATKGGQIRLAMKTLVTDETAKAFIAETKWVSGNETGMTFATTKEGTASIKVPTSVPSFYTEGGKLATLTLEEDTIGAIAATEDKTAQTVTFTVEVDADDFKIDATKQIEVKFSRGFEGKTIKSSGDADVEAATGMTGAKIKVTNDEIKVTVPTSAVTGDSIGRIEVSNVVMKSTERKPRTGEITVSIDNDAFSNADVVAAHVAEYGVSLVNATKEEKAVEMTSGRKEEVKFTLKEVVDSTLTAGRDLEFTLDQGYFTSVKDIKVKHKAENKAAQEIDFEPITDSDGNITGISVKPELVADKQLDEIQVVADVILAMEKSGDITVKAAGRALGEEKELVIATATPVIKVESEAFNLNSGIKEQKGGKIVITETDKGAIEKGNLEFVLPVEDGITFTSKPKVEVTKGDLKLADAKDMSIQTLHTVRMEAAEANSILGTNITGKVYATVTVTADDLVKLDKAGAAYTDKKVSGYKVVVPVTRQSKEASTITVTDIKVKLDRSVPTGKYDVTVKGDAIGTKGGFKQEGFFNVGIKGEGQETTIVTTITENATEMIVNNEKVELPAAAYIKSGKLMAPLRAVANAFGFKNDAINYNSVTKEILVRGNGSVVKLTIGSNQAYVDGTPVTLASPAEIKADSTYVPVGDLGRLLGLKVEWDNATKTATFKN